MKYFKIFLAAVAILLGTACEDTADRELYFIGDSIIARWDLAEYFPAYICHNYGRSGSGVAYIESLAGTFAGKTVVVLSGTNDNLMMTDASRDEYAGQYIRAIKSLGADRVYLYSVLPRDFGGDRETVNEDIRLFDNEIKNLVAEEPSIIYIDVFNDFMLDGKINPQYYNDNLHLSPYGYEILRMKL